MAHEYTLPLELASVFVSLVSKKYESQSMAWNTAKPAGQLSTKSLNTRKLNSIVLLPVTLGTIIQLVTTHMLEV